MATRRDSDDSTETPRMSGEPTSPTTNPRHPDTTADQGTQPPDLNPEDYGFRKIEETQPAEGPGAVEPTRVEPVSSVPESSFASRRKAVQSSENKAVGASESK